MEDQLCFVQFLHPGREHEPETHDRKEWNVRDHRRKFLQQPGRFVNADALAEADIVFWGEWEPESRVLRHIPSPVEGGPRFVYSPYYVVPVGDVFRQNTDPFVFGDHFRYVCCQQYRPSDGHPTQLRYLKEGSVLLFGSSLGGQFGLDTVFVVADYEDYTPASGTEARTPRPSAYDDVTLKRIYPYLSYRLYRGASYADPYHGMYSFFPCRPAAACPAGFARPRIINPQVITGTHTQGRRLNKQGSLDEVQRLWEDVLNQVIHQNLDIGVYARVPDGYHSDGSPVSLGAGQDLVTTWGGKSEAETRSKVRSISGGSRLRGKCRESVLSGGSQRRSHSSPRHPGPLRGRKSVTLYHM